MAVSTIRNEPHTLSIFETDPHTSILALVNDYPQTQITCFMKAGFAAFTDLPTGFPSTAEWTACTIGDDSRRTVVLYQYGGQGVYVRSIFQGNWIGNWDAIRSV